MKTTMRFALAALFVASLLVAFREGMIVERANHDPVECFWAEYDSLAVHGKVIIDSDGAWSVKEEPDGKVIISGFSRPQYLGTILPGQSKQVSISLPLQGAQP